MNPLQHDIDDWRFYKHALLPIVPTFKAARQKVMHSTSRNAVDANMKHLCSDCNKVNKGLNPSCTHASIALPWLRITAPTCFKYEKVKSVKMNVMIVLDAVKDMYKILSAKNVKIRGWSEVAQFVLKMFDNKQIRSHESQSQHFIPIVHSFFIVMKQLDVKPKLRITVLRRYTNHHLINVIKITKDAWPLDIYEMSDDDDSNETTTR